jgi:hypothetical protein
MPIRREEKDYSATYPTPSASISNKSIFVCWDIEKKERARDIIHVRRSEGYEGDNIYP